MTNEELINHIKYDLEIGADITLTNEDAEKIIKALEQEPKTDVLDKIRSETEKVFCMSVVTNELRTPMEVKTEILQIIDKYKTESEE